MAQSQQGYRLPAVDTPVGLWVQTVVVPQKSLLLALLLSLLSFLETALQFV